MRKNKTLRFLFVLIANLLLFNNITIAMPVDSTTARKVATNFYNWKSGRSVDYNHAQLVYTQQIPSQGAVMQTSPATALYVFDFGGHFVMTSADTRVTPVLAYSTESGFDADGIAESIGWFLDEYVQEIEFITRTMSDSECEETVSAWNRLVSGEMSTMATATNIVSPLISTTWNQSSPYNSFCPADPNGHGGHVFAGCVACAMAQLIRHWEYPSTGIGSHSYESNFAYQGYGDYGTQSVNFSTANYNYSLMPLTLNGASQAQINEVAKLMYHCGVSVEMKYGPYGSGASDYAAVAALQNHFGFEGAELKTRGNDAASWTAMIKNELNNLRPVYYSGQGSGGHAFICDGYDNQNYFHFNWGWGGLHDGFFTLSNLTPGNDNFSYSQVAIIGIDASQPKIHCATNSLAFLSEANSYSATKPLIVVAAQLSDYIIAEVSGNFRISNNGTNFYTSRTLNTNGGTLYVRYQPTVGSGFEHGLLILRSGSTRDTVLLTGAIYNNTPYCLPPANLSISSQNLQDINLQWEAPTVAPDPHTLTWSPSNPISNYGSGSNYQMTMLQRYCDTDLVAYHNQALTSISFIPDEDATLFRLVVYKGGNNDGGFNPGTLVVSQNVSLSSLQMNTWNTVSLNTPVVVDATQELWFGVYIEAPGGTYCLPLSNNSVPKKGSILGMHSAGSVSWSELNTNRSFCIRGNVENVQTVTNYQVSRNGTSLGTTTATHFQDHLSGTSTNTYTVTANWSNGCSASMQRTFTNVANITATPEVLDFFSNHGFGTLVKTFIVGGSGLTSTIQATVSGNFLISVNGTAYSTSVDLPSSGGTVYVKYTPATPDGEYETGLVTLISGNLSATVSLSGQCYEECNPPQDLTLSQSGNNIMLDWDEPAGQIIQQQELSWTSDVSNMNISMGIDMTIYLVQRFDVNDLADLNGKQLTKVSFIPNSTVTSYKVVVFKGGGLNNNILTAGTQVVNQNVNLSSLTMNNWNSIVLDSPVTIDANQELWFGIYLEAPSSAFPIKLATPYVSKKGCLYTAPSYSRWFEYYNSTYCFALKATIEDAPITITHYQIDRDEDMVSTTNNTAYNDQLIYNGDYDYGVWAVWSNGCKAAVRGDITVTGLCDHAGETFSETSCENYFWNGTTYNQSGEYYYTHYANNGCPIIDTLHLTIYHGTHNVETETACESFVWHGTTYTSSGTYNYDYTNEHGCQSNDILHLTVNHGTHNVEHKSVCDSYVWHGVTYTESGTYIYEYTNANGCPSADTLHLTVAYSDHIDFTAVACEEYTWNNETFSESGNYTRTFTNTDGCDSVVTLHLTIHHGTFNEENQTVCESYTWHGTTYTTSGVYTYDYTNEHGCQSNDILHLTVNHGTHNVEHKSVCDSYVWHGVTYTESGTYIYEYTNANGCPSADTLHLTVSYSDHVDFTAVACEEYTWNNETFSESGNYTRTFTNTDGCDSVVTLHLTIHHGTFNEESHTVCESYTWHGTTYTTSGIYTYDYTNEHGCESQDVLILTVNRGTHHVENESTCDSYEWHGETYTESGTFVYEYTNANGCASADTLHLTVNSSYTTPISAAICEGGNYNFFGQQLTTAGTYTHTLQSVHGCDSVISLTLTVNPVFNTPLTAAICEGGSYNFFGQNLTTAGTYSHTLQSIHGCDSVITLTLTVNDVINTPISAAICEGGNYNFFGQQLSTAGAYTHTLQSVHGCDSVISLTLTVNPVFNTPLTAAICDGGSYNFFGQTLTTAGTYTHTLQSVHGCDSVISLTLTVNPVFNTPITAEICEGGIYNFFGQQLTTAGTYTHTLQSVHGCDSVISLTLTVNPVFNTPVTAEICEGGSYNFFGQTLTTAGTYTHTLQSVHGCDSVISLTLTVNPVFNTPITAEICEGGIYNFFGQQFTTAGTYTHTLQSVNGCDSVITLTLTVNPVFNTPLAAEICEGGSYNFFGQTLTTAGTYTHTLQSIHGCDSVITLTLTVNPVFNTPITAEICEGGSYNFFGQNLSTAGTYSHTLQSVHGCDSVITLTLTVNPVFNTPISAEICKGGSYNFFGQTLTTAGSYTHTLQSVHGCDSVITLTLTVNPVFNTPVTAEICEGGSYNFFGHQLTTAGTYTHTLQSTHGCDSVISLTLTVNQIFNTPITAEICEGGNYSFFGQNLTTAGTYTHTLQSIHGCDSVITLTLTVNPVFNTPITAEICEGSSYNFFGQTLTTAGTYTHTLQSTHGCDSVITLTLTVNPVFNTPITAEICEGGSYNFFGQNLSTAGTYTHTLQSVHGCDSVITLTLTVNPVFNTPITAEICEGSSYNFFGQTLTTAGTYTHTLQSTHGCDSVISLTLTVNPVFNTPISAEICNGGSYNFFGQNLSTAGTYTHTLQTIHGCDSVITLTLMVNPVFNTPVTAEICEGGSYNFFGQTLTTAGTYTHTLQSVHGCDSVITLTLTVNPVFNTPITAEICEGGIYNFFGQTLTTAGTFTHTLQTIHGCDSVISLTLTVNPVFNTPISAEICNGGSYNFFGQNLSTAGTYTHTLQTIHGCDSVITLTLMVNPVFNTPITAEICEGGSYNFFGQTLTTAGTYTHTLQSVHGCDSVITLTLTVNDVINTPITAAICDGGSYNFFGQDLTTAGTYTHTAQSIHGCDSVITLTLTVNPVFNTPIAAEICEGDSYNFFGQTLTTAGTYTHTLQSVHGCDSVISLTLTVNPVFNTPIAAEICEGGSYNFFGHQLTTTGTYTHTLQSVHGCDSVITFTLTVNPVFNTPIAAEICEGDSYNFFGQQLTTAGAYTHTLQSVHGCDSVITLTLTVNTVFNTPITAEICEGGSYNFFGQTLTTAGTYNHTLQSVHGCDSVITLTLTVNPVFNTPISAEICEGGSYNFFGQNLTTAGTYTHTLQTIHGCDSVISLMLTVNPVFSTPITAEICEGSSYNFFGQNLTTAGTYNHTLQSVHGCDSVITLTLTVNPVFNTPISAEICEGGSYNFFGQNLTTAGTYTHTLQTIHGCDSVISLTLTVNQIFNTPITAEICEGGSYSFFGQNLTTAGTYTHTLQSVHGCDSVITLTLTVNHVFNTPVTAEICEGSNYDFFGQNLTTAGTYTHTLQSVHGCDSVITLTLTVNPVFDTPITAEICEGSNYDFFGQTLTTAGTYSHTLQSVHGCDSVITLTLTVLSADSTDFTEVTCDSYTWNGVTYTTSGDYLVTLTNANGCDSVVTLHLTVNPSFDITVYDTAVRLHEYTLGDFQITPEEAGTFTYDLAGTTAAGCDSTVHLILTVLNNDGIPVIETANVEIFPNPAHALLNIKGENMRKILIYNTDGQIVYFTDENVNDLQQVDVSRYVPGQYFVKIIFNNKQSVTKKVVVNRK